MKGKGHQGEHDWPVLGTPSNDWLSGTPFNNGERGGSGNCGRHLTFVHAKNQSPSAV